VDYEALAEKLVNQCAGIREGDCVWINGGVQNVELLEDLAVQVRKAGAFPLTTFGTDRMDRRLIVDVPEKWDNQHQVLTQKLLEMITVMLSVSYQEKMDLYADIPAKRLAALNQASAPVQSLYEKRRIRSVNLGNVLYPTADRAKLFGVPLDTLSKLFWDGVNVDYNKLHANCEAVKNVLAHGKDIRVTQANGTDLTFGIGNRTLFASDGIIPPEDPKKKSKVQPMVWLPAGEVITTPVPGTARGKVVIQTQFYMGKEIKGLTLTFDKGKLLSMTAESGIEPLLEQYNTAPLGKELFAAIDFGTNPSVHIPVGSRMKAYMAAGMVNVSIGGNSFVGGENSVPFGQDFFLPGSTVTVDGKVLVENGALKI
jgi:leucyl aminopeptidase (aminopeptidase T)